MTATQKPEPTPLDGLAAAIEADTTLNPDNPEAGTDQGQGGTEAPMLSNAQMFAGAIAMGTQVFTVVTQIKAPQNILTHERCAQLGELWGPVLDKYGINAGQFMGAWQLEIAAIMGTVGIVLELRTAVRAEVAQRQAEQGKAAEPEGVTGSAIPA
jgi:hypothetical protein